MSSASDDSHSTLIAKSLRLRWGVWGVFFLLVMAWLGQAMRGSSGPGTYLDANVGTWDVLHHAHLRIEQASGTSERDVTLPHLQKTQEPGLAVYTLSLQVKPEHQRESALAVCVPRWSLTGEVWFDGVRLLGMAGQLRESRDSTRPRFVSLPAGLALGAHALQIRLHTQPELDPGLSEIWFGDGDLLRQSCEKFAESKRDRGYGSAFMMGLMCLIGLFLWGVFRDDSALYFSLTALSYLLHFVHLTMVWLPMSLDTWSLLYYATRIAFAVFMFLFCLRFQDRHLLWLERGVWLAFAGALLALWWIPAYLRDEWLTVTGVSALLGALYFLPLLLRYVKDESDVGAKILVSTFVLAFIGVFIDMARRIGLIPHGATSMAYTTVPMLIVCLGLLLVERLIRRSQNEVAASELLRDKIEVQRQHIESDYVRLQQQREQLLVLEERRRIVRDMHDGLGSQLVSAQALLSGKGPVPVEVVADLIDASLWELRSVIDVLVTEPSTDPNDDPVSSLLGSLRWRLEPVLRRHGITLDWRMGSLPPTFLLSDAFRLHLLRLIQEAFTNVLKHSGARQARFDAHMGAGCIEMSVMDDGQGFVPSLNPSGLGLLSMEHRAQALGARWSMRSTPGEGTRLNLTWPWPPE